MPPSRRAARARPALPITTGIIRSIGEEEIQAESSDVLRVIAESAARVGLFHGVEPRGREIVRVRIDRRSYAGRARALRRGGEGREGALEVGDAGNGDRERAQNRNGAVIPADPRREAQQASNARPPK